MTHTQRLLTSPERSWFIVMQRLCIKLSGCFEIFTQRSNRFPQCWKTLKFFSFFFFFFFTGRHKPYESVFSKWLKGVRENVFAIQREGNDRRRALNERDTVRCGKCCGVLVYTQKKKQKKKKLNVSVLSLSLHVCVAFLFGSWNVLLQNTPVVLKGLMWCQSRCCDITGATSS